MLKFFEYNWQVRDEWFDWCRQLTIEELLRNRQGGVGSILYTLFHIIDVEYIWIRGIQGKGDIKVDFADYDTPKKLKTLSDKFRKEITDFLKTNLDEVKEELVVVPWDNEKYIVDDILQHVIAHEIHHIGQLSIWSRELDFKPVSANLIGRKFKSVPSY